jgi:hypothetical protein
VSAKLENLLLVARLAQVSAHRISGIERFIESGALGFLPSRVGTAFRDDLRR